MNKAIEGIFNNKILFSGIGIFLVMLYHQPTDGIVSGIYFYPGFVGVDIFLLFSGYGLCFSYNKNNLKTFYSRRVIRVVPLLMTLGLLVSFIYPNYHLWDYICNMTTLSYYRLGGDIYEWYLAALLLFYLAFPLLYRAFNNAFMDSNLKVGGGSFTVMDCNNSFSSRF